jgi:3-oxosteroid 1-dehydrogenase
MNDTYDVVVVGSGGGALTAAYLAQKHGLRTVVVEKTGYVGGTSAYSGGACWLPGSEVQQRANIADSTESARTYLDAILENPDAAKIEAFLMEAPRLVAELEADEAFDFEWLPFPEYYDAPGRPTSSAPTCRPRSQRWSAHRSSSTGQVCRVATPSPVDSR